MVCNVIEECRCYAYADVFNPRAIQICGVRKGPKVLNCPAECCAGGCPGQDPNAEQREPFRIIEDPAIDAPKTWSKAPAFIMLLAMSITFLLYRRDLKINPVRKI